MSFMDRLKKMMASSTSAIANEDPDISRLNLLLDEFIESVVTENRSTEYLSLGNTEAGKKILALDHVDSIKMVLVSLARHRHSRTKLGNHQVVSYGYRVPSKVLSTEVKSECEETVVLALLRRKLPFQEQQVLSLVDWLLTSNQFNPFWSPIGRVIKVVEDYKKTSALGEEIEKGLKKLLNRMESSFYGSEYRQIRKRIEVLLQQAVSVPLVPGEEWSEEALSYCESLQSKPEIRDTLTQLLLHCQKSDPSRPSKRWLKTAKAHLGNLGEIDFLDLCKVWFPLVGRPRTVRAERKHRWQPDPENWLEIHEWMLHRLEAMRRVFKPRVKTLNDNDWVVEE